MKSTITFIAVLVFTELLVAQQWNGAADISGNIFRQGNIGIGLRNPDAKVVSKSEGFIPSFVAQGSAADYTVPANQAMQFGHWDGTTFTERMRIGVEGKVGIGVEHPEALLDIWNRGVTSSDFDELLFHVRAGFKDTSSIAASYSSRIKITKRRVYIGGGTDFSNEAYVPGDHDLAVHRGLTVGVINFNKNITGGYRLAVGGDILAKKMDINDSDGTKTITLDGEDVDAGGRLELRRGSGERTIALSADLDKDGKGALLLYKPDGVTETVRISGSLFGTGGGYAHWTDKSGNVTVKIHGDNNGEGKVTTQVLQITGGSDLSEQFDVRAGEGDQIEPGMIVSIDPGRPGELRISERAYDPAVAGVISGAGGIKSGMLMGQHGTAADGQHPVALTGRVYCRADAGFGAIQPGDLITTSPTPGHGMKADPGKAAGAIVGKAMTPLASGKGLVLVLVSLQ